MISKNILEIRNGKVWSLWFVKSVLIRLTFLSHVWRTFWPHKKRRAFLWYQKDFLIRSTGKADLKVKWNCGTNFSLPWEFNHEATFDFISFNCIRVSTNYWTWRSRQQMSEWNTQSTSSFKRSNELSKVLQMRQWTGDAFWMSWR